MDQYWLPSSTTVIECNNPPVENASKPKDGNVGLLTNTSMASFANIFAGATAAIASNTNVDTEVLQSGKNFMVGGMVPSLNQIDMSSANQLSKRSGVFPISCTLPGMGTISNIGLANGNMIISGTPAQISGELQQITSGQISFASAPQMTVAMSKDFIQQAAAESGVTVGLNSVVTQPPIYTEQSNAIPNSIAVTIPADLAVSFAQDDLEKPIKCSECDLTFKQSGALNYHTFVTHAQLQDRPHKCTSCPESFLEPHHLEDHVKAVHSTLENTYKCSECHTFFTNGGCLNYHIYMAHTLQGPRTLQYMCTECNKSFMKASLLNAHVKNVHGSDVSNTSVAGTQAVANSPAVSASGSVHANANKLYPCPSCDKVFKLPLHLRQHILASHEKPHKCESCGKGFGRRSDLNRHTRGVHKRERPHTCTKCGWTFAEAGNLKHHMLAVHTKEKNYRCTICSKCFSIPSYLKTHLARVHGILESVKTTSVPSSLNQQLVMMSSTKNTTLTPLQSIEPQSQVNRCFECGEVFANASMLQNHVMSTHPQPFWCTVCGEGFSHAFQLQNHLQLRHSDGSNNVAVAQQSDQTVRTNLTAVSTIAPQTPTIINQQHTNSQPTKCADCGQPSVKGHVCCSGLNKFQQVALTAAMAIAGERPHLCTKCGKGFKTATHLKQHVRCVHTKDRPHKCQRCQKTFARMSDLNRHVKGVHDKLKPPIRALRLTNSKCSECGASFSETSQLKRHFLTVHLHKRLSFKCADCQEGFPDEASFKSHICHEQDRPHICSICSKRFTELAQVRRHMRSSHNSFSSQQRHSCSQCKRAFSRPVDLDRHVHAVHLKEKPHKCHYCNKYFGLHGNLNKHIRAVHMMEKPHQCVECGKCFAHIGVLKRHLRDIHFYDRRPNHHRGRLLKDGDKLDSNSAPTDMENREQNAQAVTQTVQDDSTIQSEEFSHLTVLQALEALQQEHQQQHAVQQQPQALLQHEGIQLTPRTLQPQLVQQTQQLLRDQSQSTPSAPM